ncbi:flagellar FliL protein [Acidovorax soli]|uniref:Flagellar protein FliL n=1 Tax=Acidovorax soli TaxID=592050 RepID=A0A7X0UAQ8_9BURK|nr:flagellar basal body-associated FliL family protein [Acidovorax soli]MBB6561512.1 flagellar FliL protein [Acidovorax soli]
MSANAAAPAKEKPKSKKMLIIVVALVLVLGIGGAAAFFLLGKKKPAGDEEEAAAAEPAHQTAKTPPTFLPFENMVVNLADPGGDRFAQIGITVEVADAKTAEQIKLYLPSIRSSVLLLVSQRTSGELLAREGKEKLAKDILREVSRPLGYTVPRDRPKRAASAEDEDEDDRPVRKPPKNPVQGILFSSFIIQ